MDLHIIYSKTAKGSRAVMPWLGGLSSQMKRVLSKVNGKLSGDDILLQSEKLTKKELQQILLKLENEGYIQRLANQAAEPDWLNSVSTYSMGAINNYHIEVEEVDADALNFAHSRFKPKPAAKIKETTEQKEHQEAEVHAKAETEGKAKEEMAVKEKREAKRKAQAGAAEKARLGAIEQAKRIAEAEAKARKEIERIEREKAEADAKAKAKAKAVEEAKAEAERKAAAELVKKAKQEAEEQARLEAERIAEAAEKARLEAEEQAKRVVEAEAKVRLEAERIASEKAEVEAKVKAKAEEKARQKAEAENKAQAKAAEKARLEADAQVKQTVERIAKAVAQAKALAAEEAKAAAELVKKAKQEAEEQARLEAERIAEAVERGRLEAEEQAKRVAEAAENARLETERIAREKAEAADKAKAEADARLIAETQSKAAEEARLKKEAAEQARLETERTAREEAEKQARIEGERKAKAEAEKKAQRATEKTVREEAERLARQENEAKAEDKARAKKVRLPITRSKWASKSIKTLLVLTPVTVVLIVGLLHIVNLSMLIKPVEKLASDSIGEPVTVKEVHVSLFPQPRLMLTDVTVGSGVDIKVSTVYMLPEVSTLFDEVKVLKLLEVGSLTLNPADLGRQVQWVNATAKAGKLKIGQIALKQVSFTVPGLELAPFNGKVTRTPSGEFRNVELVSADRNLTLLLTPQNGSCAFTLTASIWQPPLVKQLELDEVTATGVVNQNQASFTQIEAKAYGGTIKAQATVDWTEHLSASGNFELTKITLQRALSAFGNSASVSGTLNASATFASSADQASELVEAAEVNASFEASGGKVNGVALTYALLNSSGSPPSEADFTRFDTLTGNLQFKDGQYKYKQLALKTSQFYARGNLDIGPDQIVSGKVRAELTSKLFHRQANFNIGGEVAHVKLQ